MKASVCQGLAEADTQEEEPRRSPVVITPIAAMATRGFLQALLAHDARMNEQEAERDRVGYNRLNKRSEAGWSKVVDVESAIEKHTESSVLALGASLMIGIQSQYEEENVLAAYRASLRVIRPQLVGAIAEDADRVLAEQQGEAAAA